MIYKLLFYLSFLACYALGAVAGYQWGVSDDLGRYPPAVLARGISGFDPEDETRRFAIVTYDRGRHWYNVPQGWFSPWTEADPDLVVRVIPEANGDW